ncbi:transducin (beta)-like 1 [Fistulifera solaris]|uniref:Transducin (Beta)-like 1 n=1 Tax=Fistulifera solaris TaxID=1519565 RepID=A0A1Z5K4F1_FISSO|nr:transducin (beta)-like 1 [Fistulifera solaris]|eukprot:GAX21127.1 transducin (beta)-like 1 [Fistulifera solaris]
MAGSVSQSMDTSDGDQMEETSVELNENVLAATSRPQMTVSSDEVNYLVFRYLQECGFVHSAFSFAHESMLGRTGLRSIDKIVPPGTLITFLQKGLQYVGIEEGLHRENSADGKKVENENDFSLLSPATIASMTRENPPIQLNVPPAAAAAAVKARLEAQAKIEEDLRNRQVMSFGGSLDPVLAADQSTLARQALVAQAAAAQAAVAMSQLQQQMGNSLAAGDRQINGKVASLVNIALLQSSGEREGNDAAAATQTLGKRGAVAGLKRSGKKLKTAKADDVSRESFSVREPVKEDEMPKMEEPKPASERESEKNKTEPQPMEPPIDETTNDETESAPLVAQDQKAESLPTITHARENGEVKINGEKKKDDSENGESDSIPSKSSALANTKSLPAVDDSATAATQEEVLILEMHVSEVFMCAWNPVHTNYIATGSGDASARIWEMGGKCARDGYHSVKLLPHGTDRWDSKNKDVTTLEWASNGEYLATGSYDGVARIWSLSGALLHTLRGHNGPVFSLKWNKRGNYLLSGSYDRTTIVWDVSESTGFIVQQFTEHNAPALDVDWKDDETFASCSSDKTVQVCKVGSSKPLKVYLGHTDEVNGVKWDPTGRYLASCSDDCTAKIWDVDSDRSDPLFDLKDHSEEIYTLKWSPVTTGRPPLLATASFDGKVILWNIEDGSRYRVFDRHRDSVYSVSFSPSGDYLASGALAGQMYIWDIKENCHVKSYQGTGDIFEVAWNKEETRVAGCFSSNTVAIVDFVKPTPGKS